MKLDKLDVLFSEVIRRRAIQRVGGCERCLQGKVSWKDLQCAHFHGRSKKSVRWDTDNSAGICGGCHMYLDGQAVEKVEFFKKLLGEESFDCLQNRARTPARFIDRTAIELYLKQELENLKGGNI